MMNTNNNRITWIDTTKGIAILLVILGHVVPTGLASKIINSFHMPLFFMISGMFIISNHPISEMEFIYKKFWRLYVPYVLYGLFVLSPWNYIYSTYIVPIPELRHDTINKIIGILPALRNDWQFNSFLWFLPCMFIVSIIIKTVYTYAPRYKTTILISLFILGVLYNHYVHRSLPLSLDAALISLPFIMVGIKLRSIIKRINWAILIGCIFMTALGIVYNPDGVSVYNGIYGNYLLFLTAAIFGSLSVIYLCYRLPNNKVLAIGGG